MSNSQQELTRRVALTVEQRRRLITLANTEIECEERARFQPYLAVQSERSRPSQIFVVAFTGVAIWKKVVLPNGFAALDLPTQLRLAGQVAREHYRAKNGSCGPFGKITGYALARTYDNWIGLGVDGEMVQRSIPPVEWGEASLRCGDQVLFRNGKYATSPVSEGDESAEPLGFATLPKGLRLICAPPAAGAQATWSSILLRHHFGPEAVAALAPGEPQEEYEQAFKHLIAEGARVVAVGHGETAGMALRLAERHNLPLLFFVPEPPDEEASGTQELARIQRDDREVIQPVLPAPKGNWTVWGWGRGAWQRTYSHDNGPEKGLPGLLRDVEAFLAGQ